RSLTDDAGRGRIDCRGLRGIAECRSPGGNVAGDPRRWSRGDEPARRGPAGPPARHRLRRPARRLDEVDAAAAGRRAGPAGNRPEDRARGSEGGADRGRPPWGTSRLTRPDGPAITGPNPGVSRE